MRFGAGIGVSVSFAPPGSVRHDAFPELHSGRVRSLLAFSPPSLFALGDEAADAAYCKAVDKVSAMAEDRERLWQQVGAADFLSPEKKRAMLGIS